MTILVIGGDHIDKVRRELSAYGLHDVAHWSGRKPADARREIPQRTKLVVMVTDQLNHAMLRNASIRATRLGLPIVYTRRSGYELADKLAERYQRRQPKSNTPAIAEGWFTQLGFLAISY